MPVRQILISVFWLTILGGLTFGWALLNPLFAQTSGQVRNNSGVIEFYNGSSWRSTDNGDTGVGCPTVGGVRFNSAQGRLEFCNGSTWRSMNSGGTTAAAGTTGAVRYSGSMLQYNTGTHWVDTSVPTLSDTGLVVRYFLNEATSGTGPATVTDSASTPHNLTTSYAASLSWTEASGNSGLISNATGGSGYAASGSAIGTNKIHTMLNGATKFTMEFVVDLSSCYSNYGRLIWIGTGSGTGNPGVGCTASSAQVKITLSDSDFEVFPSHDPTGIGRSVYHVVVDTTLATAADRAKLYRNGSYVTNVAGIPQNTALALVSGTDRLYLMNRSGGLRSVVGTLFYAAIYNIAMDATTIATHATILAANDD